MSTHEKETFFQTYNWVKDRQQLPWAHEEQSLFLADICERQETGKALDIGCGGGTDSIFLARHGWDVTALDFMPKALEFTDARAKEAGLKLTLVEADITEWEPAERFDVILDHGLLHNMDPVRYGAYREVLMKALADDGHFVLLHWHPLFPGQRPGEVGPTRRSREEIKDFFAPELTERFFACEEFEDLPDMVGGGMTQAYYWFRRNPLTTNPGRLLEQVRATCERHDIDTSALAQVPDELLCRVVGPGRLGLTHKRIEPAELAEVLSGFAATTGTSADELRSLFSAFAADENGGICHTNPKCSECGVLLCKRLRDR